MHLSLNLRQRLDNLMTKVMVEHSIVRRGRLIPIILDWEFVWIARGRQLILDDTKAFPEVSFQ